MTTEILLCSPTRTAIGAFDGSLKTVPAPDLGAVVIKETLKRELGFNEEIVNVKGGAIAHGHPLGTTGHTHLMTIWEKLAVG